MPTNVEVVHAVCAASERNFSYGVEGSFQIWIKKLCIIMRFVGVYRLFAVAFSAAVAARTMPPPGEVVSLRPKPQGAPYFNPWSRRLSTNYEFEEDEDEERSAFYHVGEVVLLVCAIGGILFVLLSIQVWYKKLGMNNVDLNDLESWDFGDGDNTVGGKSTAGWLSTAESSGQRQGYAEIPRDIDKIT